MRRPFGPLVAIQPREEWNRSTPGRSGPQVGGPEDDDPAEPPPGVEPAIEELEREGASRTADPAWVESGA